MVKHKGIVKFVVVSVLMVVFVALPILSVLTYESVFGHRFESPAYYSVEDFPGLQCTSYEVESDKGQILKVYNYYREDQEIKGMIIMSHGFGAGGHNGYMPFADIFTQNGYYALAYDATGNGMSEGESMKGLSQGLIDLDKIISFVESQQEFQGLPIMLFGHSWGGYCVSAVLSLHPEVTAVCELSGFNKTTDMFLADGLSMVGPAIYAMSPYVTIYDRIKFGSFASYTAEEGFGNTDAPVMIIHSEDDHEVPIVYGYDIYYEEYADDPRFTFVRYSDYGHGSVLGSEHREDFYQIVSFFDDALKCA